MKETLINGYLKIEPVNQTSFMASARESYEEMGKVIDASSQGRVTVPIGSIVRFDSFMVKKYPKQGVSGEFDYYIHIDEVVSYENQEVSE